MHGKGTVPMKGTISGSGRCCIFMVCGGGFDSLSIRPSFCVIPDRVIIREEGRFGNNPVSVFGGSVVRCRGG